MLTSTDILGLALSAPNRGRAGRIEAVRRRAVTSGPGGRITNPTEQAFLSAMAAQPTITLEQYAHPSDRARALSPTYAPGPNGAERVEAVPLSPSDLAWLQRLPREPEAISADDAVTLASLAKSAETLPARSADRRLVESVWAPLRDAHDLRAAETDLRNAQRPPAIVPAEALDALAQAISREVAQLSYFEAHTRAQQQLRDAITERDAEQAERIAAAAAARDEVKARIAERTASSFAGALG